MIPYDYDDVLHMIRRLRSCDDLPLNFMLTEETRALNDDIRHLFEQQIMLLEEVADNLYPQTVDPDYQTIIPQIIEDEYAENETLIREKIESLYAQLDCLSPKM